MKELLTPEYVIHLVEKLTEEEACELLRYAEAGGGELEYLVRTSEWLRRRFKLDRHTVG